MLRGAALLLGLAAGCSQGGAQPQGSGHHAPWDAPVASSQTLKIGGAVLQVDFGPGALDLKQQAVMGWIRNAANAVTVYYGRYPVPQARILVLTVPGDHGVLSGTTWGGVGGFPAFTRMRLGEHTTADELTRDWTMTHEMVHAALPSLPDNDHWLEEGLSTYVEPVARVQAGQLTAQQIWSDMVRDMPKGQPRAPETGLEHTDTWASTYWGGALFCLVADVSLREKTGNRKGLQDALRGILAAGGTIDQEWPIVKVLETGDRATGTSVLMDLYAKMGQARGPVDLDGLWKRLGIELRGGAVIFDDHAPFANVRRSITAASAAGGSGGSGR